MKKILVVGASGATGRQLVQQLLKRGQEVVAVVRGHRGKPAANTGLLCADEHGRQHQLGSR